MLTRLHQSTMGACQTEDRLFRQVSIGNSTELSEPYIIYTFDTSFTKGKHPNLSMLLEAYLHVTVQATSCPSEITCLGVYDKHHTMSE